MFNSSLIPNLENYAKKDVKNCWSGRDPQGRLVNYFEHIQKHIEKDHPESDAKYRINLKCKVVHTIEKPMIILKNKNEKHPDGLNYIAMFKDSDDTVKHPIKLLHITIDTYIENEYKVITFSPRRSVTFKKDEIVYAAYKEILTTMKYIKSDCKITLKPNEDASIGIKSLDCNKVLKLSESSI